MKGAASIRIDSTCDRQTGLQKAADMADISVFFSEVVLLSTLWYKNIKRYILKSH